MSSSGEQRLENKVAVVTGGNSGIGLATARTFVAHGARVAIFGRDSSSLQKAARELGPRALPVQGDVRRLADLDRLLDETVRAFGKIDVLVPNAGIAKFSPIEATSEALFDEIIDINLKGAFFTVQRALSRLNDGASIVLVAGDQRGRVFTSVYAASKTALIVLARSLSAELLPRRIRVNVVSPGMTETPIILRSGGLPGATPEAIAAGITSIIPLRRRGTAEEMAKAILFFAGDDSSYCFGSELVADGGLSQLAV
jgi:NAD(P)-dependent dehydrogenase (short-subunit alcohol dehydrogenase family)